MTPAVRTIALERLMFALASARSSLACRLSRAAAVQNRSTSPLNASDAGCRVRSLSERAASRLPPRWTVRTLAAHTCRCAWESRMAPNSGKRAYRSVARPCIHLPSTHFESLDTVSRSGLPLAVPSTRPETCSHNPACVRIASSRSRPGIRSSLLGIASPLWVP